ncbi:MAG: type II secretion system protein [Planctomycetota bacterium]
MSRARRPAGITLVELLIVVVCISILALLVLPAINSERRQAVGSALAANVAQVSMVLEQRRQFTSDGSWPATLDPTWFVSGQLPSHPDQMVGVPLIETVSVPFALHPRDKVVQPNSAGAYWYNCANGSFRARVKQQPTTAETLELYNFINQSTLAALAED